MKRLFFALTFLYLFVLGTHDLQAQEYVPGYYDHITSCIYRNTSFINRIRTAVLQEASWSPDPSLRYRQ